jgi:hypothetical protein
MPEEQTKDFQAIDLPQQEDEELSDEDLEGVAGGRPKGSPKITS